MGVILSAGLTPAWQQIMVFDRFRSGEVNRAAEVHWCASGKVFNAAIAVRHLGAPSLALATVGGPPQELIQQELRRLSVSRRLITTRAATRVCTTILDRATGTITELVENGRPLSDQEREQFCQAYAEEVARADVSVIIGSLPVGTGSSFYRRLVQQTLCPTVLDFRGPGLAAVLDLEPLVVKPNREELAQTVGHELKDDDQLIRAMGWLNAQGAQWAIVTQGADPVWVRSEKQLLRLHPPPVEQTINPIGCGDAMAAGIAVAVRDGRPPVDAIRLGIGAALENLRQLLPGRIDRARAEALAAAVGVEVL
ncbi:MAG TPA: hypothetical protein EYP56_08070 [Planctomycetaceae bacterium]|nr:hypothetical protein [Planctomycetaceae bacterium]HIQ21847.1 hypothetical protein [Planctomycetota bacterium]